MKRISRILLPILAAIILLTGCNSSNVGLFFSLENVVAIVEEDRGLDENANITSFAETVVPYPYDEDGPSEPIPPVDEYYYLLTTNKLMMRIVGKNSGGSQRGYTWKSVNLPSGTNIASKVISDGTNIILHASDDGSGGLSGGLYTAAEGVLNYDQADSVSWTQITIPTPLGTDERIAEVFLVNGDLVISVQRNVPSAGSAWKLYNVTQDNDLFTQEIGEPIIDIVYDGVSEYWIATPNYLFNSNDIAAAIDSDLSSAPAIPGRVNTATTPFHGFVDFTDLASDGSYTYLLSSDGYVYYSLAGFTSWSAFDAEPVDNQYQDDDPFFTRAGVTDFSGSPEIYAGTRNQGYVILDASTTTATFIDRRRPDLSNVTDTALYNSEGTYGYVRMIVDGQEENVVFALTPKHSLWRGSLEGSYLRWVRE